MYEKQGALYATNSPCSAWGSRPAGRGRGACRSASAMLCCWAEPPKPAKHSLPWCTTEHPASRAACMRPKQCSSHTAAQPCLAGCPAQHHSRRTWELTQTVRRLRLASSAGMPTCERGGRERGGALQSCPWPEGKQARLMLCPSSAAQHSGGRQRLISCPVQPPQAARKGCCTILFITSSSPSPPPGHLPAAAGTCGCHPPLTLNGAAPSVRCAHPAQERAAHAAVQRVMHCKGIGVQCAAAGVHASRVTASGQLGRQARQALPCTCATQQTG